MKKDSKNSALSEQEEFQLKPVSDDGTFSFACYPGISCFNRCCHDIDVVLTPFDVLRMKRKLGIRSDVFLAEYTLLQTLKDSDVPLLKLKMDSDTKKCAFLNEKGCGIYECRPVVCRNYPTGFATQNPKEGDSDRPYFIIEEDMCLGHGEDRLWTMPEWKENQGVSELDELNKPWLQIVARLKSLRLKDDKDQKMNIFIMASFDLDTFKNFVFESRFLSRFEIAESTVDRIRGNEEELLKFGFHWLEFALFAEGPIKPRK
ncbi:MAG: YkgJ family cysteine cluster protein [Proteobacteria bacterium]|nr:YkgJ family cysteine cluster protein [Pseudomonadota bacterium]